jgi:hypothetical protein
VVVKERRVSGRSRVLARVGGEPDFTFPIVV